MSSASICDDAPEALAEDVVDRAAQVDHAVDRVHAHRRQPAARRLVPVRAPRVRLQRQRIRKRHRRFDVQDRAELARADPLAQLGHLRMKAAVVAEAERDAGLPRRRRPPPRRRPSSARTAFHRRRACWPPRPRSTCAACSECGVASTTASTRRIGQQRLVAVGEPELLRVGERLDVRRDRARRARPRSGCPRLSCCTASTSVLPHHPRPDNRRVDHRACQTAILPHLQLLRRFESARTSDRRPATR